MNKEASYYVRTKERVHCELCPKGCILKSGQTGICGARTALGTGEDLKLYTTNFGEITALAVDPIEKKPLYEFHPGTSILSVGSYGCNLKCSFCQNYSISQSKAKSTEIMPDEIVSILKRSSSEVPNLVGIAFTYNEPSIWFEYVLEASKLIKKELPNMKVVLVTNGYINRDPLNELLPYVDAMNIDLKGNGDFYNNLCKGELDPILETIEIAHSKGIHIETTTLLIGGENTDNETLEMIGDFLVDLNPDIPVHLSRYFPNYKLEVPPTNLQEIKEAYKSLSRKIHRVYVGNLTPDEKNFVLEDLE